MHQVKQEILREKEGEMLQLDQVKLPHRPQGNRCMNERVFLHSLLMLKKWKEKKIYLKR